MLACRGQHVRAEGQQVRGGAYAGFQALARGRSRSFAMQADRASSLVSEVPQKYVHTPELPKVHLVDLYQHNSRSSRKA